MANNIKKREQPLKTKTAAKLTLEDLNNIISIYIKGCDGVHENCKYERDSLLECEKQVIVDKLNEQGYRKETM